KQHAGHSCEDASTATQARLAINSCLNYIAAMPSARIFCPDKTAMQSGKAGMKRWILEFIPPSPLFVEPLMGWTGSRETTRQVRLSFPTKEAAIAYAQKHGLTYEAAEPHKRNQVKKAYADNFKYKKEA